MTTMRQFVRFLFVAGMVMALVGCGGGDDADDADDGDGGSGSGSGTTEVEAVASRALSTAGEAPAAEGSGLTDPPGEADRGELGNFGEVAIAITDADGEVVGWCVLLADSPELRQRGLMEVEDLEGYSGMLFVWDTDATSQFYMRNTPMPLSIAWFAADGELVAEADMEPCGDEEGCPLYPADGALDPYRFALEVPQGELEPLGVEEGSTLRIGGDCVDRSGGG